jgi:hypothetical protein
MHDHASRKFPDDRLLNLMPELLTQAVCLQLIEGGRLLIGTVAGFIPEWRPASNRNTRPA